MLREDPRVELRCPGGPGKGFCAEALEPRVLAVGCTGFEVTRDFACGRLASTSSVSFACAYHYVSTHHCSTTLHFTDNLCQLLQSSGQLVSLEV